MNDPWRLDGRRALVTGGSRGIGLATVEALLERGADVALVARDQARLEWLLGELAKRYPDADVRALAMDLSYPEDVDRVPAWLTREWSSLDILVNNVGTNIRKPTRDYRMEEFHQIVDANLAGCFQLCRGCHPLLAASRSGAAIVNVASVAGLLHIGTGSPYAMTKAAMLQLTRNLACEWATDGIRVNAIAPWYIDTELVAPVLNDERYLDKVHAATPMGRVGHPEEAAAAIVFLTLPGAGYITGQCLAVDGGFTSLGFSPP
ncbi:MAG: SDR family oxidoreductase [Xanthomonadales bacterium]|nr:SDR family oxidoreductase [Xanthomonadales bacterium]